MDNTMYPDMKLNPHHIDTSTLQAFENTHKISLPEPYRKFLLKTNGGIPNTIFFPIFGYPRGKFGSVQVFFGLGGPSPFNELAVVLDIYAGGIPLGIVPIIDDGGGNYVCFDLRTSGEKLVYWDKSHFWGSGQWRESDLYPVADSFDEFLGFLQPSPY
jgi:SMI1 / KNR4 family (SUKH-1)